MSAWRTWWQGLARRERIAVASGAAFTVAALLFVVAIEPAWRDRIRIQAELPALRDAAARVESFKDAAIALRAGGLGADRGPALKEAASSALHRAGVQAVAEIAPDGALVVMARAVSAAVWLPWVETFARDARLRIASARAARTEAPGLVDAEVRFAPSTR